uniref:Uncharacterized protein n=1 Tax=Timema monikensis TaxID=170555 RepID=A0A7R9EAN2_9NEOP|nr:unnamed protein product [Timema monikensis]
MLGQLITTPNSSTLKSNIRRFRRVCEHIQSQVCSRRPPPSPRATRKFTTDLSESSSCGSDTSERLSPYPGTRQVESDIESDTSVFDVKSPTHENENGRRRSCTSATTAITNNNTRVSLGEGTTVSCPPSTETVMTPRASKAVRSNSESKSTLEKCVTTTSGSLA